MKKYLILIILFIFQSVLIGANNEKFGMNLPGVITSFNPHGKKLIALTFDACSGRYDKELIDFLIKNKIKATLFISGRWIDKNANILKRLAKVKYFEIENHGLTHRPLTVHCESAYGIKGLCSPKEVIDEIKKNEKRIYDITGIKTKFFRSGTAHYDIEGIRIAHKLGYKIIGFTVNADYGATASIKTIYNQVIHAKPGSIIIAHMNHPEKNTYEGIHKAILKLKKEGYKFVKLDEVIN